MFVQFIKGKKSNPIAFINKKVAFPPRGATITIGDWWEVEIAEERPTTVMLKLIENFSNKTEMSGTQGGYNLYAAILREGSTDHIKNVIHPYNGYALYRIEDKEEKANIGQTWKWAIDHEKMRFYPQERIETPVEKLHKEAKVLLADIQALCPPKIAEHLYITSPEKRNDKDWDCYLYGATLYTAISIQPFHDKDYREHFVATNLPAWITWKTAYDARPQQSGEGYGLAFCHDFEGDWN